MVVVVVVVGGGGGGVVVVVVVVVVGWGAEGVAGLEGVEEGKELSW